MFIAEVTIHSSNSSSPNSSNSAPSHHEAAIFGNPRAARAFADYLTSIGIANKVLDSAHQSQVLLLDASASVRFHVEFKRFLENPEDTRYLAASWNTEHVETEAESQVLAKVYGRRRFQFRWFNGGPVTMGVTGVCLLIFVELFAGDPLGWWQWLQFFPNWAYLLHSGQWWRWVTTSVSHYQVLHVAFNVLWWWDLAGNIERRQGALRLFLLFVILNIVSNLSQFIFSGPNFLGLSGVVYGLLGYLWIYAKMCPRYPEPVNEMVLRSMLIWLVICFTGVMNVLVNGAIANAAHVGGLLAGMALGYGWGFLDRKTR